MPAPPDETVFLLIWLPTESKVPWFSMPAPTRDALPITLSLLRVTVAFERRPGPVAVPTLKIPPPSPDAELLFTLVSVRVRIPLPGMPARSKLAIPAPFPKSPEVSLSAVFRFTSEFSMVIVP